MPKQGYLDTWLSNGRITYERITYMRFLFFFWGEGDGRLRGWGMLDFVSVNIHQFSLRLRRITVLVQCSEVNIKN